ncbi:MAG: Rhodanese domain protein [Flavipsychrobacter sp.]|jgi:rhodanese-related sulfurtransferase|nr:Rhodanese domain protein [Flavipsychrobacter sp.]
MIETIKKLLGIGPKVDLGEVIATGGVIVDVRTPGEFAGGHLKNSINIPLQVLPSQIAKLKKDKPVITCCASGMRSASARAMLKAQGYTAYNGGSWYNLKRYER